MDQESRTSSNSVSPPDHWTSLPSLLTAGDDSCVTASNSASTRRCETCPPLFFTQTSGAPTAANVVTEDRFSDSPERELELCDPDEQEPPEPAAKLPPRMVMRVNDHESPDTRRKRKVYRKSRVHEFLDDMSLNNAEFEPISNPRKFAVLVKQDDEHKPLSRRQRLSDLGVSFTRSLDSLEHVGVETDLLQQGSQKSITSLSSEEDLDREMDEVAEEKEEEFFPINAESDAESTEYELDRVIQSKEQRFGDTELVAGFRPPTCKCCSSEPCFHRTYWKARVTRNWNLKVFQGDDRGREIILPRVDISLSEEVMEERVSKMTPRSMVLETPP